MVLWIALDLQLDHVCSIRIYCSTRRLLSAIDVLHAKAGGVEVEYQIAAATSDALFSFIEIGSGLGAVLSCSTLQSVGLYYS